MREGSGRCLFAPDGKEGNVQKSVLSAWWWREEEGGWTGGEVIRVIGGHQSNWRLSE